MTDYERHFHPAKTVGSAKPRGCLIICHGMAEHQARYFPLVEFLNQNGWHVATYDHPGHGARAQANGTLGQLGNQGWTAMTDRLTDMLAFTQAHAENLPLWLMGHSMGSFTVLDYAMRHPLPPNLRGLLLIGSDSPLARSAMPLNWLSGRLVKRQGANAVSPLLQKLTFGAFNKRVPDAQTDFDWICSDTAVVAEYLADPLCGFDCSVGLWHELSKTLLRLRDDRQLKQLPDTCQVIVMAGGQDPVGRFGAGPKQLTDRLRQHGPGAELKLYPTLRHEILNETDKRPVWADLQRMVADFTVC